jgi:hypothetical protein
MGYEFQNGRSLHQSVTVTWQLRDVGATAGGFCCVPGSHHANYPLPVRVASCEEELGLVRQLEFKAGDVLLFADGALCHGTLPWRSPTPRRAMLAKYQSRGFHRGGDELVQPANRWGDAIVEGMSDEMLVVMRGPDRDARHANVPRLHFSEGVGRKLEVCFERGSSLYSGQTPSERSQLARL